MAATSAKRQANRMPALLDAAAVLFAERGYHATTIRDVAAAVAMTAGAIYFHVPTKQHLLVAVYEEGVRRILGRLEAAISDVPDPSARLLAAVEAHLHALLDESAYARVVTRVLPSDIPEVADRLIALRERYEAEFRTLLSDLPLAPGRDRRVVRLFLIGALNWTPVWYRPDGKDVATIAREMLALLVQEGAGRSGPGDDA